MRKERNALLWLASLRRRSPISGCSGNFATLRLARAALAEVGGLDSSARTPSPVIAIATLSYVSGSFVRAAAGAPASGGKSGQVRLSTPASAA
jgi:hypothetical protein